MGLSNQWVRPALALMIMGLILTPVESLFSLPSQRACKEFRRRLVKFGPPSMRRVRHAGGRPMANHVPLDQHRDEFNNYGNGGGRFNELKNQVLEAITKKDSRTGGWLG